MNEKISVSLTKPVNLATTMKSVDTPDHALDPAIPVTARSFKIDLIDPNPRELEQWKRTVKAYKIAKVMHFQDLANAGKYNGERVEEKEGIDAFIKPGWETRGDELIEEADRITAWQDTGESITINFQLPAPSSGGDLVPASQVSASLKVPVLEGISISQSPDSIQPPTPQAAVAQPGKMVQFPQTPSADMAAHDEALANNPFLKKAA